MPIKVNLKKNKGEKKEGFFEGRVRFGGFGCLSAVILDPATQAFASGCPTKGFTWKEQWKKRKAHFRGATPDTKLRSKVRTQGENSHINQMDPWKACNWFKLKCLALFFFFLTTIYQVLCFFVPIVNSSIFSSKILTNPSAFTYLATVHLKWPFLFLVFFYLKTPLNQLCDFLGFTNTHQLFSVSLNWV